VFDFFSSFATTELRNLNRYLTDIVAANFMNFPKKYAGFLHKI